MDNRKTTDEQQLTLHTVGDVELWYAAGQDGSWSLPIYVQWMHDPNTGKDYGSIDPACGLYYSQLLTLRALFETHALSHKGDWWLLSRPATQTLLHKAPGCTVEYYYRWPDAACPLIPPKKQHLRHVVREGPEPNTPWLPKQFVKHISGTSGLPSSVVGMVMEAIAKEAPEWMVKNREHLDLGFCRIVALPFRVNWKQIVAFKCDKFKLGTIFNKPTTEMLADLETIGMPGILCSTHNMALKRGGQLDYCLEVIPSPAFDKAVAKIEAERQATGPSTYIALFENAIERLYRPILSVLANWCAKARAPFAEIRTSGSAGVDSLRPAGAKQVEFRGMDLAALPVRIVADDSRFSVLGSKSDPALIQAQADAMSKVRDLSPATDDLWKSDYYRKRSRERQALADGLYVPHASESTAPGEPMLLITENTEPGVEGQ